MTRTLPPKNHRNDNKNQNENDKNRDGDSDPRVVHILDPNHVRFRENYMTNPHEIALCPFR